METDGQAIAYSALCIMLYAVVR